MVKIQSGFLLFTSFLIPNRREKNKEKMEKGGVGGDNKKFSWCAKRAPPFFFFSCEKIKFSCNILVFSLSSTSLLHLTTLPKNSTKNPKKTRLRMLLAIRIKVQIFTGGQPVSNQWLNLPFGGAGLGQLAGYRLVPMLFPNFDPFITTYLYLNKQVKWGFVFRK